MLLLVAIAGSACLVAAAFSYNITLHALWRHATGDTPQHPDPAGGGEANERIRTLIETSRLLVDETSERIRIAESRLAAAKRLRDLAAAATLALIIATPVAGWSSLGLLVTATAAAAAAMLGVTLARVGHHTDRVLKLREALNDYERDEWVWRKEFEQVQSPASAKTPKSTLLPA